MEKIVVSLTSYPERIQTVYKVIESLFNQTEKADRIILWLSRQEFVANNCELPTNIRNMLGKNGFGVEWVEKNLRSHKKYLYALQQCSNAIVITVDDDVIYSETLISDLISSYRKFPHAISARRVRVILREGTKLAPYVDWDNYISEEEINVPREDLCAIGVGGILYPPFCASKEWFDENKIRELAQNQDDLWLKFNEIRESYPVVYTKSIKKDIQIESGQKTALSLKNMDGGDNDICIQKLTFDVEKNYLEVYKKWFLSLNQKEEYTYLKKKLYGNKLRSLFLKMKDIPIFLFGAGERAKKVINCLNELDLKDSIENVIVSDKLNNPQILEGIKVKQIDEICLAKEFGIICGVSDVYRKEMLELLKKYNYKYVEIDVKEILHYYVN